MAFPLVWGLTDCSTLDRRWQFPDVVIAADVIYHRELMTPLFDVMSSLGEAMILQYPVHLAPRFGHCGKSMYSVGAILQKCTCD